MFDHINLAAVICDFSDDKKSYKIKEVNKYLRKLEKINKKDIIGKELKTLFPGVARNKLCSLFTKAWNDKSNDSTEFELEINKDGSKQIRECEAYRLPTDELVVLYNDITKESQLDQKLADSEEKFRTIFENSNDGIFLIEGNMITECNEKTVKIFGCKKKSDIIGLSPVDFSPPKQPDDQTSLRKAWKLLRATINKGPQRFTWLHNKKNGELFDAEVSLKKVRLGDKNFVQATVQDVTEKLNDRHKLETSENKFRSFFDNSQDAIFIAELKSRKLVDANNQALKLTGYSKKELFSMKVDDLHPSKLSKETIEDGFLKQAKGEIDQFETLLLTKEKLEIPVSITTSIYQDENGVEYIQGSFRDISAQKEVLDDLAESESKFRSIIQNAEAIIFLIDKKGQFLLSEGRKLEVIGLKPGQAVGENIYKMYKDYPSVIKGFNECLTGKIVKDIVKIGDLYFDVFFSPQKDTDGSIQGVIGMSIDITENKLAMLKLMEINQKKNEFISMASHQLRTPLGNMRWGLELILNSDEYDKNKKLITRIKKIHATNVRLVNLVGNLLNISRIESDRVLDKPVKLDLIQLLREIIIEDHEKIEKSNLKILLNTPNSLTIYYDEKLLREVLANLVSNAIKFNKQDGVVLIEVKRDGQGFSFAIANTGMKILKSDHEGIFQKFYRGTNTSEQISGSGLGLHISREYILKWNGNISFESPVNFGERSINGSKYSGTVFTVNLPVSYSKVK